MNFQFINNTIERENIVLPESDKINSYLLKNHSAEIIKAIDFLASDEKSLHLHGFLGTGKRQFINYVSEFLSNDVLKLEYFCKEATVCDDIFLNFNETLESIKVFNTKSLNTKITTLGVKFQQNISSTKRPIIIILHSFDDILDENLSIVSDFLKDITKEENVKVIVSTRAMQPGVLGDFECDRKIFLKSLTKENFKSFLDGNKISAPQTTVEDFYKYTRGYYYYTALTIKILQAMKIDLSEFLKKYNNSGMSFDSFLSFEYINLLPTSIRNFFWFLRTVRHGITLNALASLEIYDEFSIEFLKTNLMIFEVAETLYVQDYFLQKIDISIPDKTQIKLHKYIIGIYEGQIKSSLKDRVIFISRQALRAEIEYHKNCIYNIENKTDEPVKEVAQEKTQIDEKAIEEQNKREKNVSEKIEDAVKLMIDRKFTNAIEAFHKIIEDEDVPLSALVDIRVYLARLYKQIGDYTSSCNYYDLAATYYSEHKEFINLNYLCYEMADLYFKMYKKERAVETVKKVIYSVDTPQSLMVSACTLLGNIYSEMGFCEEAFNYYKKALESLDDNVEEEILANLYFKFALANDDKGDEALAFEYYNKCISLPRNNPCLALAYSNLASCYYEKENYDDAGACFKKAYQLEKDANNYEGIYYTSSHMAKILLKRNSPRALEYLNEAKRSAEFINDEYLILEATIALGDYYYNDIEKSKEALKEYFIARNIAMHIARGVDISNIEYRINDMKKRMNIKDFEKIEKQYAKK